MHKCYIGQFFENAQKSYWLLNIFLAINNVFLCIFKNTDQDNICVSIVLEAKTIKKNLKKLVDPQKGHFLVLK